MRSLPPEMSSKRVYSGTSQCQSSPLLPEGVVEGFQVHAFRVRQGAIDIKNQGAEHGVDRGQKWVGSTLQQGDERTIGTHLSKVNSRFLSTSVKQ